MNGIVFLVLGCFLTYVTFWVISDRVVDYHLGRDGTPLAVIVIIVSATAACLFFGLAAMFGRHWPLRVLLAVGTSLGRR